MRSYLIILLNLILVNFCFAQDVDESCTDRNSIRGTCKILLDCPSAMKQLKENGRRPDICGFIGVQPIVCCLPDDSARRSTPSPNTVRKSDIKCAEYAKSVYQNVTLPSLIPNYEKIVQVDMCGFIPTKLIVGGENATNKEFPHMALLGYDKSDGTIGYYCGGSLISERYVLTAGHCLISRDYGEVKYCRLGEYDLTKDYESVVQDINIIERIKHPDYMPPSQYNDIALVRLERDAVFDAFVRPICLHTNANSNVRKALATGWGHTDYFDDEGSKVLLKVILDFFTNEECNNAFPKNARRLKDGIVDTTQLCAGSKTDSKDTCQGDSGGPLQIYHPTEYCMYWQVGVTSFGKACGVANNPGVFTRVYYYLDWIENIVWPDN